MYPVFLQNQVLKAQKRINHEEHWYQVKQFFLASASSYCNFHILFICYLLNLPLWTSLKVMKVFQVNLSWNFLVENKMFFSEIFKSLIGRKTFTGLINYYPLCFKIIKLRTDWINRCLSIQCLLKRWF